MKIFSVTHRVFLAVFILLLSGCASNPNVQVNEVSNSTTSYDETVHINNCGGKADSQQTKSRSFSTEIQGGIDIGVQKIVEGIISAKYSQSQNASVSQSLIAPAGTNMEFVLRWSEEIHAGNVTANGTTGTYTANIPIAVEHVSSQDLGCEITQSQPTVEVTQGQEIIMPDAPLYDDFEGDTIDTNKWGQPVWGNPEQYTPIQSQGALHFEISKDWFDWAVNGFEPIEEMYALVTVDGNGTFGISLRILASPGSGYNLMLQKDKVLIWNDPKELGSFQVSGTCCTHLLGAKVDGKQIYFYVDNVMLGSYPFNGYPDYGTLQIAGTQSAASAQEVRIKFRP